MLWWTLRQLKSKSSKTRREAVVKLGNARNMHAVEPLTKVLKDNSLWVQQSAVEALMKLGWQPEDNTQRALVAVIKRNWNKVADFGVAAVDPLMTALKAERETPLGGLSFDNENLLACLAKIGNAAVEPLLGSLMGMGHERFWQRIGIIRALGQIGDVRAIDPLMQILQGESIFPIERMEAGNVLLVQFGDIRALEPFLAFSSNNLFSFSALPDLSKLGDAVIEPLMVTLTDKNKTKRTIAAVALGHIGNAQALDSLVAALKDPDSQVRAVAAEALGDIGDARALDPLITALEYPYPNVNDRVFPVSPLPEFIMRVHQQTMVTPQEQVSTAVARALGRIGDARALGPLVTFLLEGYGDSFSRCAAAEALGRIGDARALDPLVAALKNGGPYLYVCIAAAKALGDIGDAHAVEPLLTLTDMDRVSGAAIEALQKVLECSASNMDPEQLGLLAALINKPIIIDWQKGCWGESPIYGTVDCTQVRQLARQELIRRGLQA